MKKLGIVTKTVHEIDCLELERFVQKFYGISGKINLVADEEWSNYESHTFTVEKGQDIDQELGDEYWHQLLREGKGTFGITNTIMNDFTDKNEIPEGDYIVSVYW